MILVLKETFKKLYNSAVLSFLVKMKGVNAIY